MPPKALPSTTQKTWEFTKSLYTEPERWYVKAAPR